MDSEQPPHLDPSSAGSAPEVPPLPSETVLPDEPAQSASAPTYKDRSTGLAVFGVGQIILGIMSAVMVPLAMLGLLIQRHTPGGSTNPRHLIPGLATYLFLAVVLLTLGIGSIQAKRWARALTLIISWYWLAVGVLVTILLTAVLPVTMRTAMAQAHHNMGGTPAAPVPTGVIAVILTVIIVMAAFFLVLVPIAFVIFYSRSDVAETCRHRDPVERWTDRAPLPVVGASVVLALGSAYMLVVAITTPLFPFFGRYLTGTAGTAGFLVLAVLDLYLAYSLYRLQSSGWWLAMTTLTVRIISMVLTYARADLMRAYSRVGFSDAQLRIMNANPMIRGHVILWWSLFSMVILFGFLIWIKRYFNDRANPLSPNPLPVSAT